jgi:hypothetical protein
MPHPMLYGSRIRGYAPYAQGLWFSPTEWIIRWIPHKRKLANPFILFRTMNNFLYHILPIMHAYNAGISGLRSYMPDSGQKTWLRSYAQLRSYISTPDDFTTPVVYPDSDRCHVFGRISRLWSHFPTSVDIMTLVVPRVLPPHLMDDFAWLS